ncbi:hypothetical protein DICPUDRAFT_76614 [Dictyostelium purpureum]|uniref:Uncharacterized protein n=1 Tax=Dictyostelium purpureum TaxID=5786 RepID=F0ZE63_DICPU|nr:uncharacterized protein DICPUDRAFT_76614 [Dictyostelium purpureum]EGC37769.1 hypothetical protein DICPUDRAFT_76614 [Dictyostelium purpureum]|eukprot:XP_003285708.1 hypothetical protein DICPUDRAFT_76614 [Dictyostelium purpureum]
MKLIFALLLVLVFTFNFIQGQLPRYDTLSLEGVDDNTCSRLLKLDTCEDICGPAYIKFTSEPDSNQVEYQTGKSCDSLLTKVNFPCDPEVNTTFTITVEDVSYKYAPKCSCIDKSKCTGIPKTDSSSANDTSSSTDPSGSSSSDAYTITVPILVSTIPLLALLF